MQALAPRCTRAKTRQYQASPVWSPASKRIPRFLQPSGNRARSAMHWRCASIELRVTEGLQRVPRFAARVRQAAQVKAGRGQAIAGRPIRGRRRPSALKLARDCCACYSDRGLLLNEVGTRNDCVRGVQIEGAAEAEVGLCRKHGPGRVRWLRLTGGTEIPSGRRLVQA